MTDRCHMFSSQLQDPGSACSPHGARIRFSLLTLLLAITFAGVTLGLGRILGVHGFILPLDLLVLGWAAASLWGSERRLPSRFRRLTFAETVVLLLLCFELHGLALPAVQSGPHPRRNAPAAVPPALPTLPVPTDSGSEAEKFQQATGVGTVFAGSL